MKILILAGGTGGHILPGLAVAEALKAEGAEVVWLGTERGLENQLVPKAGIGLYPIQIQGLRGKGKLALVAAPFRLVRAVWQAVRVMRELKVDKVAGFGGFVSGPGGFAAWLLRKPLIIHEQNAIPGLTNRCLAHLATQVFQAFPNAFPASRRAITCGNPVRKSIAQLPDPETRLKNRQGPLKILLLGGSQGAAIFNTVIPEAIAALPANLRPEIWHSAGKNALEKTAALYQQYEVSARVVEFIDDMANAYAWADLVICRAGALTLTELAAAGVASILVPFPHAVDDHQTKNATQLVSNQAAILLPQSEFTSSKLAILLTSLTQNHSQLLSMATAARSTFVKNADSLIATALLN